MTERRIDNEILRCQKETVAWKLKKDNLTRKDIVRKMVSMGYVISKSALGRIFTSKKKFIRI